MVISQSICLFLLYCCLYLSVTRAEIPSEYTQQFQQNLMEVTSPLLTSNLIEVFPTTTSGTDKQQLYNVPFGVTSLCVAVRNGPKPISVTLSELSNLLLGLSVPAGWGDVVDISLPAQSTGTAQALLNSLVLSSTPGFSSPQYPSGVIKNSRVSFWGSVSDQITAFRRSSVGVSVTIVSNFVAINENFNCAQIKSFGSTTSVVMHPTDSAYIRLNATGYGLKIQFGASIYPLLGLVMANLNSMSCGGDDTLYSLSEALLMNHTVHSVLAKYGLTQFHTDDVVSALQRVQPCSTRTPARFGGSTAMQPIFNTWIVNSFGRPKVPDTFSYSAVGSGAGVSALKSSSLLVATSDIPLSSSDRSSYPTWQMVPVVAFSVSIIYNLGVDVQLSIPVCFIADLFRLNEIYWDDETLRRANPTVKLPHERVIVAVRGDKSGTTEILTNGFGMLDVACNTDPNDDSNPVLGSGNWMYDNNVTKLNGDVALRNFVSKTRFSLGYASTVSVTSDLHQAWIWTEKGLTRPNIDDAVSFLASATLDRSTLEIIPPTTKTLYPFVGVSYFIFDQLKQNNCSVFANTMNFVRWVVTSTSDLISESGYVPIPDTFTDTIMKNIISTECDGNYVFDYTPPSVAGTSVIIIGVGIGVAVFIVIVVTLTGAKAALKERDITSAPNDTSLPFAMVFTDVQWNSTMWARHPEIMSSAQEAHHSILRACGNEFNGYEVKCTDESFMFAFRQVTDAIRFSAAVQQRLYEHNWGTKELDITYAALSDTELSQQEYSKFWNGLRVRIGIDYGYGNMTFQTTIKGYVYEGSVVDTAGDIQLLAQGGQTLISAHAWNMANQDKLNDVVAATLGFKTLGRTGIELELIQILPKSLSERDFVPLDVMSATEPSETDSNDGGTDGMIEILLAALPDREKAQVMRTLCLRWRIRYNGRSSMEDTAPVIRVLCRKVAKVMRVREATKEKFKEMN